MFIDRAKIYVKAGNGGNGTVSFFTEKHNPNGGPDGGDGGKGGDIILEADARKSSLIDFKFAVRFKADDGIRGGSRFCSGKGGKDVVIKVPCGTVVKDEESGGIIADLFSDGDRVVVLEGGKGGKGNASFKSSRRQAPMFAQTGVRTEERTLILELRTIADVGLIGYPNVGKSTLLSVISAARPKIANYHFTTLSPNLGVVKYYDKSFVVADIPGLIEGAGSGAGLGTEFLRHVERTRLLVHVVDVSGFEGRSPVDDYRQINKELKTYSKALASVPQVIALNKCDVAPPENIKDFKKRVKKPVVLISAATATGVDELIKEVYNILKELPPVEPLRFEPFKYARRDTQGFEIEKMDEDLYFVSGGLIDELARNVILDNLDSFQYFQKRLKDDGVINALVKAGARDGDTVRVLDIEFDFVE